MVKWRPGDELPGDGESLVSQLKNRLQDVKESLEKLLKRDAFILERSLMSRDLKVEAAEKQFRTMISYREEHDIDHILDWKPPTALVQYSGCGIYGEDKEGHPIAWMLLGRTDSEGLYKSATFEDHMKMKMFQMAGCEAMCFRQECLRGKYTRRLTAVIDLKGVSTSHASSKVLHMFNQGNKLAQDVFPEFMEQMIIINPPRIFSMLYALIRPFLTARIESKITVVSGSKFMDKLSKHIDVQYIPMSWGGEGPEFSSEACLEAQRRHEQHRYHGLSEPEIASKIVTETSWSWSTELFKGCAPVSVGGQVPEEHFASTKFKSKDPKSLSVPPRAVEKVAITIPEGCGLHWGVMTENKDITISVEYEGSNEKEEIASAKKEDCHEVPVQGHLKHCKPGTYTLVLDNTHSRFTSKTVYYNFGSLRVLTSL
eukprot:m.26883 g.26883  ORF g.26883 m.26883 type:complete len:427 (-) comp7843_c0_seq1:832-2112(-)